jgi:hypothetical protein
VVLSVAIVGGLILLVNMGPGKIVSSLLQKSYSIEHRRRPLSRREKEDILSWGEDGCLFVSIFSSRLLFLVDHTANRVVG